MLLDSGRIGGGVEVAALVKWMRICSSCGGSLGGAGWDVGDWRAGVVQAWEGGWRWEHGGRGKTAAWREVLLVGLSSGQGWSEAVPD